MKVTPQFGASLAFIIVDTRLELARIINYDHNCSFIVLATVITIVNYDRKTFIVHDKFLTLVPAPQNCDLLEAF